MEKIAKVSKVDKDLMYLRIFFDDSAIDVTVPLWRLNFVPKEGDNLMVNWNTENAMQFRKVDKVNPNDLG